MTYKSPERVKAIAAVIEPVTQESLRDGYNRMVDDYHPKGDVDFD